MTSTQAVVRAWLAEGQPEVCLAVADEQTAGRGRRERPWLAPAGRALLVSAGFRPLALSPERSWQLPAIVSLAMLDAMSALLAAATAGLALKWPNDIVTLQDGQVRKLGGVLAEGVSDDGCLASAVVGVGINVDWPANRFPTHLAASMSSLREVAGGLAIDREALLSGWLACLEPRYAALRRGVFEAQRWAEAQITTGAEIEIDTGTATVRGTCLGVDERSGELLLGTPGESVSKRFAHGDVVRCRVGPPAGRL